MNRFCLLLLLVVSAQGYSVGYRRGQQGYHVANGTHIERHATHFSLHEPSGLISHIPHTISESQPASELPSARTRASQPTSASGWIASSWQWGTAFTYFSAQWTVPPAPIGLGQQILFWFNSVEGATNGGSGSDILQPVLQWDQVGLPGWSLTSELVSCCWPTIWAGNVNVKPGDVITGVISQLSDSNWTVSGYVNGVLETYYSLAAANFQNSDTQNTAQVAMEVYGVEACDQFPPNNQITFSNMHLKDQGQTVAVTLGSTAANTAACNAATVQSGANVSIVWNSQLLEANSALPPFCQSAGYTDSYSTDWTLGNLNVNLTSGGFTYAVDLCANTQTPCGPNAVVCQEQPGNDITLGLGASYKVIPSLSSASVLALNYTGGDFCDPINDARTTLLQFHCTSSAKSPVITSVTEATTCHYALNINVPTSFCKTKH